MCYCTAAAFDAISWHLFLHECVWLIINGIINWVFVLCVVANHAYSYNTNHCFCAPAEICTACLTRLKVWTKQLTKLFGFVGLARLNSYEDPSYCHSIQWHLIIVCLQLCGKSFGWPCSVPAYHRASAQNEIHKEYWFSSQSCVVTQYI